MAHQWTFSVFGWKMQFLAAGIEELKLPILLILLDGSWLLKHFKLFWAKKQTVSFPKHVKLASTSIPVATKVE